MVTTDSCDVDGIGGWPGFLLATSPFVGSFDGTAPFEAASSTGFVDPETCSGLPTGAGIASPLWPCEPSPVGLEPYDPFTMACKSEGLGVVACATLIV